MHTYVWHFIITLTIDLLILNIHISKLYYNLLIRHIHLLSLALITNANMRITNEKYVLHLYICICDFNLLPL